MTNRNLDEYNRRVAERGMLPNVREGCRHEKWDSPFVTIAYPGERLTITWPDGPMPPTVLVTSEWFAEFIDRHESLKARVAALENAQ